MAGTFEKPEDIESADLVPQGSGAGVLGLFGLSPDQFRRLVITAFEEPDNWSDIKLLNEVFPAIWGNQAAGFNVDCDFRSLHRVGYLSHFSGDDGTFLDVLEPPDLALSLDIRALQRRAIVIEWGGFLISTDRQPRHLVIHLFRVMSLQKPFEVKTKVAHVLQILFEIACDRRDGLDPLARWNVLREAVEAALEDVKIDISELRKASRIEHLRPPALIADINRGMENEDHH